MDVIGHVAAAPGPQAPVLGVLAAVLGFLAAALGPESVLNKPNPKYILILLKIVEIKVMYKIDSRGSKNRILGRTLSMRLPNNEGLKY